MAANADMSSKNARYTISPCPLDGVVPATAPFEPLPQTMTTVFKAAANAKRSDNPVVLVDQATALHQADITNPVIPTDAPNNPIPEPTMTTKLITLPSSTVPVIVTPHPQRPHGMNNIQYDAANAATPEHPAGVARKGESSEPLGLYKYPEPQKWFTIGILSAALVALVVFVVYKKVMRRREVRKQIKETGEVLEVRWDEK